MTGSIEPTIFGNGRMILIVDDESYVARLAEAILDRRGFRVTSVSTAQKALEYVRTHLGEVSLAVVDFRLPDMSGLDLMRDLHNVDPHLRVIVSSGYFADDVLSEVYRDVAFLQKPYTADGLTAAVAAALAA